MAYDIQIKSFKVVTRSTDISSEMKAEIPDMKTKYAFSKFSKVEIHFDLTTQSNRL